MQWALSSDAIDMAIICADAAKTFVEYDENFEIVCPLVKNSDVFLLKEDKPKSMGVTQNRNYQLELVSNYYKESETVPLINSALVYALENGSVEGIVIDAIRALSLDGEKYSTTDKGDYYTYVLVVNKNFKNTDLFKKFVKLYNDCVTDLQETKNFKREIERYANIKLVNKDMGEIKKWKLEFLQIKQ